MLGLSKDEKREIIRLILSDFSNIKEWWTEELSTAGMKIIKLLGKDVDGSEAIYSEKGMNTLMKVGGLLDKDYVVDTPTSREALRCITNCILLREFTKQYLKQQDVIIFCVHLLNAPNLSLDSRFLKCRILYFMTIGRPDLVERLIQLDVISALENVNPKEQLY